MLQAGAGQAGGTGAAAASAVRHLPGCGDGPGPGRQPMGGRQDQAPFALSSSHFSSSLELLQKGRCKRAVDAILEKRADKWT